MGHPSIEGVTFKDIDGFPGYCVGDDGSVWSRWVHGWSRFSTEWRKMKPTARPDRRMYVSLVEDKKPNRRFVHRLVLTAFVGLPPDGHECCHNDGDPSNNRLENLRWDTAVANQADKIRHGTHNRGEKHHRAKLTESQVREIHARRASGEKTTEIAKSLGIEASSVTLIFKGTNWPHLGLPRLPKPMAGGKSRFRGVYKTASNRNPWTAAIYHLGKLRHIGVYRTEEDAAMAYDASSRELLGDKALTNEGTYGQYWAA